MAKIPSKLYYWIPIIGINCFVLLFIYASLLYPGGSQKNPNSIGFSWLHNYWCNLMNPIAENGAVNHGSSIAISAMMILCGSLSVFFWQFAKAMEHSAFWKRMIQFGGMLSMLFASLIFSKHHDLMTILSSLFGIFVVIGIIQSIYKSEMQFYKISGVSCIILLGLNNCIYYSEYGLHLLPLLQKITFGVVLIWVLGLNQEINKRQTKNQDGIN